MANRLKYVSDSIIQKLRSSQSNAFQRAKEKLSEHFAGVYQRDQEWMMRFDLGILTKMIWPLFVGFICLNFLDVYTTTLAMNFGSLFHEENPIAKAMFDRQFQGYLLALAFKYLPVIPLFYIVFVGDGQGRHPLGIRVVKFTALIALTGSDILLLYVVGVHNIMSLLVTWA